jgi:hypothetical protein
VAAVKAGEYVDAVRHDEPPAGPPVTLAQRREALLDAFRGVELGRYDSELIGTLADLLLDEPARGLVSLIERRVNVAKIDYWRATTTQAHRSGLASETEYYLHGNSGPGFDQ